MLKVKGVPVQDEELSIAVDLKFDELNIKGQRRLFLENKEYFLIDALNSKYITIRKLAKNNLVKCSSDVLNKALQSIVIDKNCHPADIDIVLAILNVPHLELEKNIRRVLSEEHYTKIRLWVAKDKNTPFSLLKGMFIDEAIEYVVYDYPTILDAIAKNPNFEIDTKFNKLLKEQFNKKEYKKIIKRVAEAKETE